jgi:lysozyme family protein
VAKWKVTTHEGSTEEVIVKDTGFDDGPLVDKGALVFQQYVSGMGNQVVAIYAKDFWQKVECDDDD